MGTYQNIGSELKAYFSSHPIFKILLPLDAILVLGGAGLMVLGDFISVGGLLNALAYYGFLFGLLLAYANFHEKILYLGLFIYAGDNAYLLIKYGLFSSYKYLNYSALLACLIFGGLGYLVFKHNSVNTEAKS